MKIKKPRPLYKKVLSLMAVFALLITLLISPKLLGQPVKGAEPTEKPIGRDISNLVKITKEETKEYTVSYEFKAAKEGQSLPPEVMKLLPTDNEKYDGNINARALGVTTTTVQTSAGTWEFKGWDANDKPFNGDNVKFVGTWEFTPKTTEPAPQPPVPPVEKKIPAKIVLTDGNFTKELEITDWEKKDGRITIHKQALPKKYADMNDKTFKVKVLDKNGNEIEFKSLKVLKLGNMRQLHVLFTPLDIEDAKYVFITFSKFDEEEPAPQPPVPPVEKEIPTKIVLTDGDFKKEIEITDWEKKDGRITINKQALPKKYADMNDKTFKVKVLDKNGKEIKFESLKVLKAGNMRQLQVLFTPSDIENAKYVYITFSKFDEEKPAPQPPVPPVEKKIPAKIVLTDGDFTKEIEITDWEKKDGRITINKQSLPKKYADMNDKTFKVKVFNKDGKEIEFKILKVVKAGNMRQLQVLFTPSDIEDAKYVYITFSKFDEEKPAPKPPVPPVDKTYKVTYKFISGTADKTLPDEVIKLIPGEETNKKPGEVKPAQPTSKEVKVDGGKWVFKGYDLETATIVDKDVEFVAKWVFVVDSQPKPDDEPAPAPDDNSTPAPTPDVDPAPQADKVIPQTGVGQADLVMMLIALIAASLVLTISRRKNK